MTVLFRGSMTALITPMHPDGRIDDEAFRSLIDCQIAAGTDGLIPVGTTGESPALTHDEHRRVIDLCLDAAQGRVPVIAGTGSNNTAEAVALTQYAAITGADAALVVTPYYNKPTQEGLYRHFRAIAAATDIPILIYNIPGRSVVDMTVETMGRLARECPTIRGVKDATNDLARPLATRLALGPDFCQLSGEDATIGAFLAQGGHGCISVTANVAPALCADLHDAWAARDWETFTALRDQLMPLHQALFCESSPGPVKYAASLLGICGASSRLPLVAIAPESEARVRRALVAVGLL